MLLGSLLVAFTGCDGSPKSSVTILGGKENIKYATLNSDQRLLYPIRQLHRFPLRSRKETFRHSIFEKWRRDFN